jgi:hypothetical protein
MIVEDFAICTIGPAGIVRLDPLAISAATALKRDPEKFLEFAEQVCKVAEKYRQEQVQLALELKE